MKRLNILLTVAGLLLVSIIQVNAQFNNLYNRNLQVKTDPVYPVLSEKSSFTFSYQNYWPEIPSAFNNLAAQTQLYFDYITGALTIGAKSEFQAGAALKTNRVYAGYAQAVRLTSGVRAAASLQGWLGRKSYSFDDVVGEQMNQVPNTAHSEYYPGIGYSMVLQNRNWIVLFNYQKVFGSGTDLIKTENTTLFSMNFSRKLSLQQKYIMRPFIEVIRSNFMSYNIGTDLRYNNLISYISIAGAKENIVGNIRFGVGCRLNNYEVYYTYLAVLNNFDVTEGRNGSHEVTFLYKLQYKGKRKKIRAIKCPDI